jgi:hypothetical protein
MQRNHKALLSTALVLAGLPVALYGVPSVTPAPKVSAQLLPPVAPEHRRRNLTTASELAADLADVVKYLEAGQAYFRAYGKGSHDAAENKAFLAFLESYEKELAVAKKEVRLLSSWIISNSGLDSNTP